MRVCGRWLAAAVVLLGAAGCRQRTPPRPPAPPAVQAPKPVEPPKPPEPPKPRKELVVAWEISLLYRLVDGQPLGKPLVLNSAERQYLRDAHLGDFVISEKIREWRSNLFDVHGDPLPDRSMAPTHGAIMRNWMRIGDLALGFHYSPAFRFYTSPRERHRSHGCYRMSKEDSNRLFEWAPVGTPVYVVRSLGGTRWAFLRAHTPPELLPGYRPKRKAHASPTSVARRAVRAKHKRGATTRQRRRTGGR